MSGYDRDLDIQLADLGTITLDEKTEITVGVYSYNGGAPKVRMRLQSSAEAMANGLVSRPWGKSLGSLPLGCCEELGMVLYHAASQVELPAEEEEPEPEPAPVVKRRKPAAKAATKAKKKIAPKAKVRPKKAS